MKNSRLVYSTETGRICGQCGQSTSQCRCKKQPSLKPSNQSIPFPTDGTVRIRRETAGRGGKIVTVVYGLPVSADLNHIARLLKQRCGSGGSVKDATIIIQGDHREAVQTEVIKIGFKVKLAGG